MGLALSNWPMRPCSMTRSCWVKTGAEKILTAQTHGFRRSKRLTVARTAAADVARAGAEPFSVSVGVHATFSRRSGVTVHDRWRGRSSDRWRSDSGQPRLSASGWFQSRNRDLPSPSERGSVLVGMASSIFSPPIWRSVLQNPCDRVRHITCRNRSDERSPSLRILNDDFTSVGERLDPTAQYVSFQHSCLPLFSW
jgi:hypothetical protein